MALSANKGYSVQSAGSNTGVWGAGAATALNEGVIEVMDANMGGITSLSLSSSNVLLTSTQAQQALLRMTGTLLASVSVSPDAGVLMTGFYFFENLTSGNFNVTFTNSAGSVVLPQSRRGIMWVDTINGPRIVAIVGSTSADPIPVGTVMLFFQAAAPSGWTISALNDYGIAVGAGIGGQTFGSINYTTLFNRTATDGYTLTVNDIPSHTHDVKYNFASDVLTTGGGARVTAILSSGTVTGTGGAAATGGGASHAHGLDMRVKTAYVIMATKQ